MIFAQGINSGVEMCKAKRCLILANIAFPCSRKQNFPWKCLILNLLIIFKLLWWYYWEDFQKMISRHCRHQNAYISPLYHAILLLNHHTSYSRSYIYIYIYTSRNARRCSGRLSNTPGQHPASHQKKTASIRVIDPLANYTDRASIRAR
jgi:hypothetical protein